MKIWIATVYNYDDDYKNQQDTTETKTFSTYNKAFEYVKNRIYEEMEMIIIHQDYKVNFTKQTFDLDKALDGYLNQAEFREQKFGYSIEEQDME